MLGLLVVGFLVSLKNRKIQCGRVWFLLSILVLYAASISPLPNGLSYLLEGEYLLNRSNNIDRLDIVVVLGGGVSENRYIEEIRPSNQTSSRILYAVQVFRKSGARYLVCMGKGAERISEAEVMATSAERLGVPAAKIKVDPASRNTWEHAENLDRMFPNKAIRIGLVTSAYHMRRSEREFKKYFSDVAPLPSDYLHSSAPLSIFTFMPRSGNLYKFSVAMSEIAGIGWYRIRG